MDINELFVVVANNGIQIVLSVLWIVVLIAVVRMAPSWGRAAYNLIQKLDDTIEDNTELMQYTKDLHEKMETTDAERHDLVKEKLDNAVAAIRGVRELQEESDEKVNSKLDRIERALIDEIKERSGSHEQH